MNFKRLFIQTEDDSGDSFSLSRWVELTLTSDLLNRIKTLATLLESQKLVSVTAEVDAVWELGKGWKSGKTYMEIGESEIKFSTEIHPQGTEHLIPSANRTVEAKLIVGSFDGFLLDNRLVGNEVPCNAIEMALSNCTFGRYEFDESTGFDVMSYRMNNFKNAVNQSLEARQAPR